MEVCIVYKIPNVGKNHERDRLYFVYSMTLIVLFNDIDILLSVRDKTNKMLEPHQNGISVPALTVPPFGTAL
jgi:hypothetical protein